MKKTIPEIGDIVDVEFLGFDGDNPVVTFQKDDVEYKAVMVGREGRDKDARIARRVRDILLQKRENLRYMKARIVAEPFDGKFFVEGYERTVKSPVKFYPSDAYPVLTSNNSFYGRIRKEGRQDYTVRVFNQALTQLFGYLVPAEGEIEGEWELSDQIIKNLTPGDKVLVADLAENGIVPMELYPIINFEEEHDAITPSGHRLVTMVLDEKYAPINRNPEAGDLVLDLPIVAIPQPTGGDVGIGFLPARDESGMRYYQPVFVKGALADVSKYVSAVKIDAIEDGIIHAKKLG